MQKRWKLWELALIGGLLTGLLAAPAGAEETVLSRWTAEPPRSETYVVSLFPFSVGRVEADAALLPVAVEEEGEDHVLGFRLVQWWEGLWE